MLYPQEILEEVRVQNDIVDVISEYLPLKQKGTSYFGLCPFHNEKTPSFSVSSERQFYYCFGCGAAGNVYTFIMQMENDTFPEAVKRLADRVHITLPQPQYTQQAKEQEMQRQRLFDLHKKAGRFFYEKLHEPVGEQARAYLQQRQMNNNIQKKFGIGYAPKGQQELYQHLQKQGFSQQELQKSGLIIERKEQKGYFDRFRNRLMFPILDIQGRVIGFGGRILSKGEPKYLNSPETLLFNKSRNLYGLNFAKNTRKREIILVEGYMDMISLYQAGFRNVAASLGTAFNQEHAKVLKKYADSVILLYDSDDAGTVAAQRAIPILTQNGFHVKVLQVPNGKDPDEFIKQNGAQAFSHLLANAQHYITFQIQCLKKQYDFTQIQQKVEFTTQTANILAKLDNDIERNVYTNEIANMTGISQRAIENEIIKIVKKENEVFAQNAQQKRKTQYYQNNKDLITKSSGIFAAQKDILFLCASNIQIYNKVKTILLAEDFAEEVYKRVYEKIDLLHQKSAVVFPAELVNYFELPEEQKMVTEIFAVALEYQSTKEIEKALTEEVKAVKKASLDKLASQAQSVEQIKKLIAEKGKLDSLYITIADG
ncbi:DNA primase [Clostridium sp. MD294]|uniref:DNA primase n=1 Tax=Clostridium sp. MD294 TaxID=97138 RepID=UPI0002C8F455|nr:DNA primase [Clostridium sp. MD294]USF29008.1 DNA primase [Clostridium sp. MD294]